MKAKQLKDILNKLPEEHLNKEVFLSGASDITNLHNLKRGVILSHITQEGYWFQEELDTLRPGDELTDDNHIDAIILNG